MARVLILGAGFGGLEAATTLSEAFGEDIDVTLIDHGDAFMVGFSKLDVQFGDTTLDAVRAPYAALAHSGVRFVQERVTAIDPEAHRVTTDRATYDADFLVIALGADYVPNATPGFIESGGDLYTADNAPHVAERVRAFTSGRAVVGVCGTPYKCTPAPSEAALLLHAELLARGVRDRCEITLVVPMPSPIPPSPDTARALLDAFEQAGIRFMPSHLVTAVDVARQVVILDDATELPCDLFLGVPKHRAPQAVIDTGLPDGDADGFVPVDPATMQTRVDGVYAVGDVTRVGGPKAGAFAEKQGRVAAESIIALIRGTAAPAPYDGRGSCYVEFGAGRVGRVDVDSFAPPPSGVFVPPSEAVASEKREFSAQRRARWFGE
ncbi:MAG: NAD(P)/FAD-dependent oxidoreductase [Candidatus Dormibacteria bacterium]